jgi:hypothetical protein
MVPGGNAVIADRADCDRWESMAKIHITVRGTDRNSMADLVRVHRVRVYPQTLKEKSEGFRIDAVADEAVIRRLTDAGYSVDRHEDVDEAAQDSLRQVGQQNRYAAEAAAAERDAR